MRRAGRPAVKLQDIYIKFLLRGGRLQVLLSERRGKWRRTLGPQTTLLHPSLSSPSLPSVPSLKTGPLDSKSPDFMGTRWEPRWNPPHAAWTTWAEALPLRKPSLSRRGWRPAARIGAEDDARARELSRCAATDRDQKCLTGNWSQC